MTLDPVDVLQETIFHGLARNRRGLPWPGAVVTAVPVEARRALARLTSASIANIRRDLVAPFIVPDPGRGLRRAFDRKLFARCKARDDDVERGTREHRR